MNRLTYAAFQFWRLQRRLSQSLSRYATLKGLIAVFRVAQLSFLAVLLASVVSIHTPDILTRNKDKPRAAKISHH
jgi:hypothetical protein